MQMEMEGVLGGGGGERGRQVILLLPILHSVVFPSRRFSVKFCYGDQYQFSWTATRGRTIAKTRELPYCIIVYSVAIRPFSTLKFILGSKVWSNETTKKSSPGSAMNNTFLLFSSPKPRNHS